jgi:hypothetical protein
MYFVRYVGIEIVSKIDNEGNDVSGIEEKMNLGYECDGGTQDENKCGRLQNLDQLHKASATIQATVVTNR